MEIDIYIKIKRNIYLDYVAKNNNFMNYKEVIKKIQLCNTKAIKTAGTFYNVLKEFKSTLVLGMYLSTVHKYCIWGEMYRDFI